MLTECRGRAERARLRHGHSARIPGERARRARLRHVGASCTAWV